MTPINRALALATALLVGVTIAVLVSNTHHGTHSAARTQTRPGNPVLILQHAGCTVAADVSIGQPALGGIPAQFAACTWGDPANFDETLTVWTYGSNADRDADMQNVHKRDGMTVIVGDKFIGELVGACCSTPKYPTPAGVIAMRLHAVIS